MKQNGLALLILDKNKAGSSGGDISYEALVDACKRVFSAAGISLSAEKEKDACNALLDFVQIAVDYEGGNPGNHGSDEY